MIENIKNIALSLCALTIVISFINIISPDGKFKNIIKIFLNLFFLLSILHPILNLTSNFNMDSYKSYENVMDETQKKADEVIMKAIDSQIEMVLKKEILNLLKKSNINPDKIEMSFDYSDNNVYIDEVKIYLDDDNVSSDNVIKIVKSIIDTYIKVVYI
ncbi:MAG: stage III sporulation protein AF [Oscillospiraceae bacterium]